MAGFSVAETASTVASMLFGMLVGLVYEHAPIISMLMATMRDDVRAMDGITFNVWPPIIGGVVAAILWATLRCLYDLHLEHRRP